MFGAAAQAKPTYNANNGEAVHLLNFVSCPIKLLIPFADIEVQTPPDLDGVSSLAFSVSLALVSAMQPFSHL